jgi:hypothetical protein
MNELSVYERVRDPLEAVREMGNAIAKSRMFGCESIEQGMVFAWECFARKCSPLSLTETYHVIDGKLSMRADAMLARFLEAGGSHEILERTANRAAVQLWMGGHSQEFAITWEEAQEEGLDQSKNGTKRNWSTPRRRMQMLWARVISDGVRAMAPNVCAGKYTPEDFGQSADGGNDKTAEPDEVQTEYVVAATVQPAAVKPASPVADEATADQRLRITTLFGQLGLTSDQRDAVLRKRGVSSVRSLSQEQAAELLKNLEAKYNTIKHDAAEAEAKAVLGESRQPDEAHQMLRSGPASAGQVEEAKRLLTELEQLEPGITGRLKAKLVESGFQRLADLCFDDAEQLVIGLKRRNVEAFFGAVLRKPVAVKEGAASEANGADPT